VLLLALCLCMCPVAAIGAANPQKTITQAPTATDAPTQIAHVATTQPTHQTVKPTPTLKPTDTPVPTDTPLPTPTSVPTAIPTQAPTQAPTQPPAQTGVNGNPWGYDFTPGNLIYFPNADFCGTYFSCVSTFWTDTNGYVVECGNGEYSHSGGIRGACSRDGKVAAILYSH